MEIQDFSGPLLYIFPELFSTCEKPIIHKTEEHDMQKSMFKYSWVVIFSMPVSNALLESTNSIKGK